MKLYHHDLFVCELDDAWWEEAGMEGFVPKNPAYRSDPNQAEGEEILEININEVKPVFRHRGLKIFNDSNEYGTAKTRVIRILRWFIADTAIEPVKIAREPAGSDYPYRLLHGAHRFYCSVAAGFTHVPAIFSFDINA